MLIQHRLIWSRFSGSRLSGHRFSGSQDEWALAEWAWLESVRGRPVEIMGVLGGPLINDVVGKLGISSNN